MAVKLLALDTSSAISSVALLQAGQLSHAVVGSGQHQHTQQILPQIQQILTQAKLNLTELDALAFSAGPGSFTGIRLGASIIQGLALGTHLPAIPISTLQVIAQRIYVEKKAEQVAVAINAYGEKIYWGVYCLKGEEMSALYPDQICAPHEASLPNHLHDWVGVGDAWHVYAQSLSHLNIRSIYAEQSADAKYVANLALSRFKAGKYVSAKEALPIYLYGAERWQQM